MKYLVASALALTLGGSAVLAESHSTAEMMDVNSMDRAELIRTRDITGGDIYSMADNSMWDDETYTEVGSDWNDIGEIEDLVLSNDGQLIGIVAEIGGFLDIGDKHVMINAKDLKLVPVDDRSFVYVTRMSEEQLEELEGVDEGFWD